jgi:alanine-glyoxylate transaminase/serine-glyoxylate transaminase/serine-pyruvate transaminase
MATPLVGHMDPWFTEMMGDVPVLLREVFQTQNKITYPISASGSGGIEASVVNTLEPGDECIVCVNGWFSDRMASIAERTSAKVIRVEAPYGRTVDPEDVRRAGKGKKIKFVGLAHGETSSGVLQKLANYREVADELGALMIVDAVATLAGVPPITINSRVEEMVRARKTPVSSWYFDFTPIMSMWGGERTYHHTPPISLIYGLREALRLVQEEGLEARWMRHSHNQLALIAGLEAMGMELYVKKPEERLATVTSVTIPAGVDDRQVRQQLLDEFGIEIAGGFGPGKGKVWRVGLMGYSSQNKNVLLFLAAIEKVLGDHGHRVPAGAGVAAAIHSYQIANQPVPAGAHK